MFCLGIVYVRAESRARSVHVECVLFCLKLVTPLYPWRICDGVMIHGVHRFEPFQELPEYANETITDHGT